MLSLFADFAAGVFLCNCIPHLAAGLRGEPFPSPFATPHGVGNSRPVVNVLWGLSNAVAGVSLLAYAPVKVGFNLPSLSVLVGALAVGIYVAIHFGRVRRANR